MDVRLDLHEIRLAAFGGLERQMTNLGRSDAHGFTGNGWAAHVAGAIAEYAVAKVLGLPWSGVVRSPWDLGGDVGELEVRSTTYRSGRLIVHKSDPDERTFHLVVTHPATTSGQVFTLVGHLPARLAKQPEWWGDPQGNNRWCYGVPQDKLRPMSALTERGPTNVD